MHGHLVVSRVAREHRPGVACAHWMESAKLVDSCKLGYAIGPHAGPQKHRGQRGVHGPRVSTLPERGQGASPNDLNCRFNNMQ